MRRFRPALLIALVAGVLTSAQGTSIPSASYPAPGSPALQTDTMLLWESNHQLFGEPLDTHPFTTEFYLHDLVPETVFDSRQPHSWWLSPVANAASGLTNAASSLSKKVASLRRALIRMMP